MYGLWVSLVVRLCGLGQDLPGNSLNKNSPPKPISPNSNLTHSYIIFILYLCYIFVVSVCSVV